MDLLLLTVALLFLLSAGLGVSLFLLPNRQPGPAELLGASVLLGAAAVSFLLFGLGFLLSGASLRRVVAGICLAMGMAGIWRRGAPVEWRKYWPLNFSDRLLIALNIFLVCAVFWISSVRVLGWDGLFNFEIKARLAFQNGGSLPLELLSDPSRSWTLQSYPLLLPMTENWFYLWLGRADQGLIKLLFPLFLVAALCLLGGVNRLFALSSWRRFAAPLLVCTAPLILIGDGSASSGYADFPLAVFYLAAIFYLTEFWLTGDSAALRLAGVIASAGCWLKQEGAILWICVMALAGTQLALNGSVRRKWKVLAMAALPGVCVIVGWQAFVRAFSLPGISQFQRVGVDTLQSNVWRAPIILRAVLNELINLRHWGILWVVVALALARLLWQKQERKLILLPLAVLLPLTLYSGVYIFSLWPSFTVHLESSLPRLLVHISVVAVLMVAVAAKQSPGVLESKDQT